MKSSMKSLVLLCAVCLQIGWSYARGGSNGVGAFSYQDSAGNRYGGTYGLKDGQVVDSKGEFPPDFAPPDFAPHDDFSVSDFGETDGFFPDSGFFPEYFRNLENLLHEAFQANLENQRLAMNAAQKAFDLTSNRFTPFREMQFPAMPIPPQFPKGFPFSGPMPGFENSGGRSSFASASSGSGVNHHVAVISPGNPLSPNVDEMQASSGKLGGYKEVSVSSFSSTSDVDGKPETKQEVNTYINDNGKVTAYTVHNP